MEGNCTHWRHEHAREYAKPWLHKPRDVVSALIVGVFGGSVTASGLPTWAAVLVGICGAVVGAYLPWVGMYLFSAATAGGRLLRRDVTEIRSLLAIALAGSPKIVHEPAPPVIPPSPALSALRDELTTAELLIGRCPSGSPGFGNSAHVPDGLKDDIHTWVTKVATMLDDWPDYRKQFAGPVGIDNNFITAVPAITQEVVKRRNVLRAICDEIARRERERS